MKLIILLIFRILPKNNVVTILYSTYEFRFETTVSKLVSLCDEFYLIILSKGSDIAILPKKNV